MARRRQSLAGTHLYQDSRSGNYIWRRKHPHTGRRMKRSTETNHLSKALRKAAEFEEEFEKLKLGMPTFKGWKVKLGPLVEDWIAHQEREGSASAPVLKAKRFRVNRALAEFDLTTAADLCDVARLHDQLLALEDEKRNKAHLRGAWQEPLKQFSKWLAENGRHLDRDPLASWKLLPKTGRGSKRPKRAVLPQEFARCLLAADALDVIHGREHPTRPVLMALLVAAPRAGALIDRDTHHLEPDNHRIEFGVDRGNKRRGEGALDPATLSELVAYRGDRVGGPLFRSASGGRLEVNNLKRTYLEAFGLGLVSELWPASEPWDVNLAHEVERTLSKGRAHGGKGGNPNHLEDTTVRKRRKRAGQVLALAGEIQEVWSEKMVGVLPHGLRKTHRTWALAQGVDVVLIDKQLGHASRVGNADSMDLLRVVAGSETGRKHYLDMRSRLLDAGRSAEAVRGLLDEALAQVGTLDPHGEAGERREAQ